VTDFTLPTTASQPALNPSAHHPVIVIGAGLAGLTAALLLAERGPAPLLLEAAPRCGGRFAGLPPITLTQDNQTWSFTAEHGIHGLWGQYHNLRSLLQRHDIMPDLVSARREEWLHSNSGRIQRTEAGSSVRRSPIPAPLHYLALLVRPQFLAMLTWHDLIGLPRVVGSLYLALAYDPLCEPAPLDGRTLDELFDHWPPRLRAFVSALMRSGLAAHPQDVPLGGFLAFMRFYTLLRRDAWEFDYLPEDPGTCLITPMLARIVEHGGTIYTTTAATRLEQTTDGWRVAWRSINPADPGDLTDSAGTVAAQHLVVALDAPAARALFCGSTDTATAAADLAWPQGLSTGIVRLWFSVAPAHPAESGICSGDFTIDNFFWLHRFQPAAAAWHQATGGSLIEAHIYGPQELLDLPDATLLARAITDIYRAYPELRGHLIQSNFQRNAATHTRFSIGANPHYLDVDTPWPEISCCGDWLRYPHPALFLERACITGMAAANRVLTDLGLDPFPIQPPRPPEAPAAAIERGLRWVRQRVQRQP
jgi:carotenoid phi-ring synthase / carotenoid chi-ring synthase